MSITVYSKPNCPQCLRTKHELDALGIPYETVDLSQHREALARLVALGHRQAPVVETEAGSWSGYDRDKIRHLLPASDGPAPQP